MDVQNRLQKMAANPMKYNKLNPDSFPYFPAIDGKRYVGAFSNSRNSETNFSLRSGIAPDEIERKATPATMVDLINETFFPSICKAVMV